MTGLVLAFSFLLSLQDPHDAIRRLSSDRIEDRDAAARELKQLGDKAVPALRDAAAGGDAEVSARCRKILASLELLKTLSPRLLEVFPGLEDKLAFAPDELWAETLLEATREDADNNRVHPRLSRSEHLDALAARALNGVKDPDTWQKVTNVVEQRRLKAAIPVLIENIESDQEPVWRRSISVLGSLDARQAIPALVQVLRKSATIDRRYVADTLAGLDRAAALLELRKHFEEAEPAALLNFLTTAAELGEVLAIPPLLRIAQDPQNPLASFALAGLELFDPRGTPTELAAYLKHPDSRIRSHLVEALYRRSEKQAVPLLLPFLRDPDEFLRCRVARILGEWKATAAVPVLVDLLSDKDRVRDEAAAALAKIGDSAAIPALESALVPLPPTSAGNLISALADLGSKAAVPGLVRWLSDSQSYARHTALTKLAEIGATEAIPAIVGLLKDKEPLVRGEALLALGRLGARDRLPQIVAAFDEKDPGVSMCAARALLLLKDPRVPAALIRVVESGNGAAQGPVVNALKELRCREALPCLVTALSASKPDAGFNIAEAIQAIGIAEALPLLEKAGPQAVLKTSTALGSTIPEMVPLLLMLLKNPDAGVRANAAWMLETCGDRRAIPALEPLLRDAEEEVRFGAAFALAFHGDSRALPTVRAALNHKEQGMRLHAIRSLVFADPEDAVGILTRALDDPSPWVQAVSSRGLGELKHPGAQRALAALAKHPQYRLRVVAADLLDRMEEAARLPLARLLLEDSSYEVRASAAIWLCRNGHEEGIDEVLAAGGFRPRVVLNALRRPDLWARLQRPWTRGRFIAPPEEVLKQLCADAGLPLTDTENLEKWVIGRSIPILVGDRLSPLEFGRKPEALTLMQVLEGDVCVPLAIPSFEVVLDQDGAQVVHRDTADRIWKQWRAERERR